VKNIPLESVGYVLCFDDFFYSGFACISLLIKRLCFSGVIIDMVGVSGSSPLSPTSLEFKKGYG